jgi:hypothetical protein
MHHVGCMAALNLAWFRAHSLPAGPGPDRGRGRQAHLITLLLDKEALHRSASQEYHP